jgi:hypothetical protein
MMNSLSERLRKLEEKRPKKDQGGEGEEQKNEKPSSRK